MTDTTKLVRVFSLVGPCLTAGRLVRETPHLFIYNRWMGGDQYAEGERRISKHGRAHIEPCHSCRDHPRTQYPNGYMD